MRGPVTKPERLPGGYDTGNMWQHYLGGCESGFTIPDLTDPNIVWATLLRQQGDAVGRADRTSRGRSQPYRITLDSPPNDAKYRCHWTAPIAIDPFDHNSVYYGCQVIFKTTNGGQSWSVISPDLSTNDPSRIVSSGGIVGDNLGQFYGEVVFAIAPSEVQKGLIWAGTNDGLVWVTQDGGGKWTNVTKNIAGLPAWGTVVADRAVALRRGHGVHRGGLPPDGQPRSVHLQDGRLRADVEEDQRRPAREAPARLRQVVRRVAEPEGTAVRRHRPRASTTRSTTARTGRNCRTACRRRRSPGSPRRRRTTTSWSRPTGAASTCWTTCRRSSRWRPRRATRRCGCSRRGRRIATSRDGGQAFVNFTLASAPKDKVKLEVLDAAGAVIRTWQATARAGLNRVTWDLRHEGPRLVALRATPPENEFLFDEPRFKGKETRPVTHWGLEEAGMGPVAVPGKYTVRLTVDGRSLSQPLEILRDPEDPGHRRRPGGVAEDAVADPRGHQRLGRHDQRDRDRAARTRGGRARPAGTQGPGRGAEGRRGDGGEARGGRGHAHRAGGAVERRQVLPAEVPRLHGAAVAERRGGTRARATWPAARTSVRRTVPRQRWQNSRRTSKPRAPRIAS